MLVSDQPSLSPADILALRLCASDVLGAYEVSGVRPATGILRAIVGAIGAVPELPAWVPNASAIDQGTSNLLKRHGVLGFTWNGVRCRGKSSPSVLEIVEVATRCRPLAHRSVRSSARTRIERGREQLLDAVTLALLESTPTIAAAGLRWLAVVWPVPRDRDLILDGVRRAAVLGADDVQVCLDCHIAEKTLAQRLLR